MGWQVLKVSQHMENSVNNHSDNHHTLNKQDKTDYNVTARPHDLEGHDLNHDILDHKTTDHDVAKHYEGYHPRKRSKKVFRDYNAFRDRPFGLKWGTAYAMDELVKGIESNQLDAMKNNQELSPMTRQEIDQVLQQAFFSAQPIEIQLQIKDEFGRFQDLYSGIFNGFADEDGFEVEGKFFLWEDIRHVKIKNNSKWF